MIKQRIIEKIESRKIEITDFEEEMLFRLLGLRDLNIKDNRVAVELTPAGLVKHFYPSMESGYLFEEKRREITDLLFDLRSMDLAKWIKGSRQNSIWQITDDGKELLRVHDKPYNNKKDLRTR